MKLPKAKRAFVFSVTLSLQEATGKTAANLEELIGGIRAVEGSVIFFHTYDFLLRHHFVIPTPVSDFAEWVQHGLQDELMAEKLSSINLLEFSSIAELRAALLTTIEDHIGIRNHNGRKAIEGEEFHFVKANSFVMPTPHVAHDLGEFRDCLVRIPLNSLFFHLFEARLRLEQQTNDFSFWLGENFDEEDLATFIARQDPYIHTLEHIRGAILSEIDRRLLLLRRS